MTPFRFQTVQKNSALLRASVRQYSISMKLSVKNWLFAYHSDWQSTIFYDQEEWDECYVVCKLIFSAKLNIYLVDQVLQTRPAYNYLDLKSIFLSSSPPEFFHI